MYRLLLSAVFFLGGCATTAAPNLYAGQYYLAGDAACASFTSISSTRIMCTDKKGRQSGYRDAMTAQDLQVWQIQVAQNRAQMQQLQGSVEQLGQSAQGWAQQAQQQGQYVAPQVQSVAPGGYSGSITYRQVGDALIGSNGVTYREVGNSIIGSDGTTCQIVGATIICR